MKQTYKLIFVVTLVIITVLSTQAQKTYSTVYIAAKEGDGWGGLKKTKFEVKLTDVEMAGIYVITMSDGTDTNYALPLKFEAMAGEGKAFHTIVTTDPFSYEWTGPSGETTINWVYVNVSIKDIYDGDTAPFDFEIQFEGGSAVKYYVSP